jgi:hypothetical protein
MLPKAYRGQPGAILLAIDWAERHGLSIMDALHGVSWVQGKPVVDSTLQRALARNAGYSVVVTEAAAERATVKVATAAGELIGTASYTLDEAKAAGLTGKDNWRRHQVDMLVARATTRAIKWFCAEALIGGAVYEDDLDGMLADPVATATIVPPLSDPPEPVVDDRPVTEPAGVPIVDAEVVEDDTDPFSDDAVRADLETVKELVSDAKARGHYPALVEAMKAENIPLQAGRWTAEQMARIIVLAPLASVIAEG